MLSLRLRPNKLRQRLPRRYVSRGAETLEQRRLLASDVLSVADSAPLGAEVWSEVKQLPSERSDTQVAVRTSEFRAFTLDDQGMNTVLDAVPDQTATIPFGRSIVDTQTITLPTPGGKMQRFEIFDSPVMAPELAEKFPEIRTFAGQGIDDPSASVRLDRTPAGLHAQVLSHEGSWYVDPYYRSDDSLYASYFSSSVSGERPAIIQHDILHDHEDELELHDESLHDRDDIEHQADSDIISNDLSLRNASSVLQRSGAELRTYRLAVAATGEYTAFHGGTVALGQAAIVTAINRVSGIYENELSIRLELVANNDSLVYTDGATDPYTNNSTFALINENQANINNVIGNANYDVGHVFSTSNGGLASLGVVGITGTKARGVTGLTSPLGDPFYVDFVAHEIGHQFGGHHTFNGDSGNCNGGNRTASAAFEPGSGSTILAYAGICGNDDLQSNSDPYFHSHSFDQVINHVDNAIPSVGTRTATGNNVPTINAGNDYTIPAATPFTLTATGNDADVNDVLTYNWEQRDLGPQQDVNNGDNGQSPLFRSFLPTTDPARTFPRLSDLINNTTVIGETLPTTTRVMNFRAIVRDNRAGGGGVNTDDVVINVQDTLSPFAITNPNSAVTFPASSTQTVTWDVAGTDVSPINVSNVNILLSTDGGMTYPTTLASNVPNIGSHAVTLPNVNTSLARIKIQPVGNIFFDISDSNFSIGAGGPADNDDFVNRWDLGSSLSATDTGTNIGFSGETGEPAQDGAIHSAWWSWTAPSDGELVVDTIGSDFDTFLTLATGASVGALSVLAQNDDGIAIGLQSEIQQTVTANTEYQIAVDGYDSDVGNIQLNIGFTPTNPQLIVTNTNDSGAGSLRQAILDANNTPGVDIILFDIAASQPHLISLGSALPIITDAVTIDASSEPDVVMVDGGSLTGAATDGFRIEADDVTIASLTIQNFPGDGVEVLDASNPSLESLHVIGNGRNGIRFTDASDGAITENQIGNNALAGIEVDGTASINHFVDSNLIGVLDNGTVQPAPNGTYGMRVTGPGNTITNNTISSNLLSGISLPVASASGNIVSVNQIGTDPAGALPMPNGKYGVIIKSPSNFVSDNVLSGNSLSGLVISGPAATDNDVVFNRMGTDATSDTSIANSSHGLLIVGADGNRIESNIISGNASSGVVLSGASNNFFSDNEIGIGNGEIDLGNGGNGINLRLGSANNLFVGNAVAGNTASQIVLVHSGTTGNGFFGNAIGFAIDFLTLIPGSTNGFSVSAPSNTIGGLGSGEGNQIAGTANGITLSGTLAQNNTIVGNSIGTDSTGSNYGVQAGVQFSAGASNNIVGPDNVIAFSTADAIRNSSGGEGNKVTQNRTYGNVFGIDLASNGPTPNDGNAAFQDITDDADSGPNKTQNSAEIIDVDVVIGSQVDVTFTYVVDTNPTNATYPLTVEFFLSDPTVAQGLLYLTSDAFSQSDYNAGVPKVFNFSLTPAEYASISIPFDYGTATVTDFDGNTSEFSSPVEIDESGGILRAAARVAAITPINYMKMDVSGDGVITTRDALIVINAINRNRSQNQADPEPADNDRLDVNQDRRITALDALQIINHINTQTKPLSDLLVDDVFNDEDEIFLRADELLEESLF